MLEAARRACPESPFVHMCTNKVYGDRPNAIALRELPTALGLRRRGLRARHRRGFVDRSEQALASSAPRKVAADVMVQEYGRYFGMPTCCLRGGCLTGPNHSGVELHGFLSYLVKCNVEGREYSVFGYKGKQVRDNIHSLDVARFMNEFIKAPRSGEVYNLGGGKGNSCQHPRGFPAGREILRPRHAPHLRAARTHRRPYLLLQRSAQNAGALSGLGYHREPGQRLSGRSSRPGRIGNEHPDYRHLWIGESLAGCDYCIRIGRCVVWTISSARAVNESRRLEGNRRPECSMPTFATPATWKRCR